MNHLAEVTEEHQIGKTLNASEVNVVKRNGKGSRPLGNIVKAGVHL
jgi:hypothetical protein